MRTGEGTIAPGGRALAGLLGILPLPPPLGSQISLGGCFRSLLHSGFQVVPTPPPASQCWVESWGIGNLQVKMGGQGLLPQLGQWGFHARWLGPSVQLGQWGFHAH